MIPSLIIGAATGYVYSKNKKKIDEKLQEIKNSIESKDFDFKKSILSPAQKAAEDALKKARDFGEKKYEDFRGSLSQNEEETINYIPKIRIKIPIKKSRCIVVSCIENPIALADAYRKEDYETTIADGDDFATNLVCDSLTAEENAQIWIRVTRQEEDAQRINSKIEEFSEKLLIQTFEQTSKPWKTQEIICNLRDPKNSESLGFNEEARSILIHQILQGNLERIKGGETIFPNALQITHNVKPRVIVLQNDTPNSLRLLELLQAQAKAIETHTQLPEGQGVQFI